MAGPPVAAARRSGWARQRYWAAAAVLVVLGTVLGASTTPVASERPIEAATTRVAAPMWLRLPSPVADELVGVTINSDTGLMPSFQVGSVRLWDSETRWQNIEPEPGRREWQTMERLVDGAHRAGFPVLYVFGGTPEWAAPAAPPSTYPDGSRAAAADDLADWERFVRAVAERYQGRLSAYELWDMANHPKFFTDPPEVLVEMVRRASRVIRAVDPAATVVCPSFGQLWEPAARRYLTRFARLGGYEHCDAGAVKLYPRRAADPPETMLALADQIDQALHGAGRPAKLWSTGTDFNVPYQPPVEPERAANYAARFFLTGLYARFERMYFYNWGGARVPIVLQPTGGPPTRAARYVERLRHWLSGARVHTCRKGTQAGLPDNVWQCRFDRDGREFQIWWTHDGTARLPVPARPGWRRSSGWTAPAVRPSRERS